MFKIVFYPGTHGNYLEFILNKLIFGDKINISNPLGTLGTSHIQRTDSNYRAHNKFKCKFFDQNTVLSTDEHLILITVDPEDDITALQLNLKRGEDYNIDPDTLTENTYYKLINKFGPMGYSGIGPNTIIDHVNQYTDISPYYNIKDPSWPDIQSVKDYWNLPELILNECVTVFKFKPVCLSEQHPDAPRWVLRALFNEWFKDRSWAPSIGLAPYFKFDHMYKLNLRKLYSVEDFQKELLCIENHFGLKFNFDYFSEDVHKQFISMVPYRDSSSECHRTVQSISDQIDIPINLNVVEEGYVNFLLETQFKVKLTFE